MAAVTTSTALVTTKSGNSVDLNNPNTFRGHVLTEEQMQKRMQILTELAEQLNGSGQTLSPKSTQELTELDGLTNEAATNVLQGIKNVCRVPGVTHYKVLFGRNKVSVYKDLEQQIEGVPRTSIRILQAIQPGVQANWFQGAILAQTQSVLSSDFMSALKATLMGNMSVLRAAVLLMGKPDLFCEVLSLYSSSNDLYNKQIAYNRGFELEVLQSTDTTYGSLKMLHQEILSICGPTLVAKPELAKALQDYEVNEAKASLKVNVTITTHCNTFLREIDALKVRTLKCVDTITAKNEEVKIALEHMTKLLAQQNELTDKQNKMQAEFEAYQNAKQKELNSRRVTDKVSNFKLFGLTLYSSVNTEVTRELFGSDDAHGRYLALKQQEAVLSGALTNAKDILAVTMAGVISYGQDKNSLKDSMQALSNSVLCVHQLEIALNKQREQAQSQIDTCKKIIAREEDFSKSGMSVENALFIVEKEIQKTIQKQALWLASQRQTCTLQNFQQLEQEVRLMAITVLTEKDADPSELVTRVAGLLSDRFPSDPNNPEQVHRIVQAQLVPYTRMLPLIEGTLDYDEKG